ncbi:MAG TPA: glycoside hydrolase family 127 protein [Puia sp.]|nr:glycoside hydrolase family 127 protein [Puia sp.]
MKRKRSKHTTVWMRATVLILGIGSGMLLKAQERDSFRLFPLQEVSLLAGPFKDAQLADMRYMLALDPDRLLAPYLKEAGLTPKKPSYGNWENTGLDGHIGGHYLSALSFMYAATGNPELNRRLDYMLKELKRCQDKIGTGYLCGTPGGIAMWKDIAQGKIIADTFSLNGKWVPLYNLHKVLAGLRDAYLVGGKPLAKQMLIRLTDYIDQVSHQLSDTQIQTMLISEQGGLNEVFADVAAITGEQKYLVLARRYSHRMLLNPLMQQRDELDGLHANMQIPKAVGFERIAQLDGDTAYAGAARFFWQTVTANRTVAIGGNSVNEHFNKVSDYQLLIGSIAGPETCNTYNMLKLTRELYVSEGRPAYLDYYERALFNHILSSEHPTRGGFVYYTSMRPRQYRVYSQPQECMWCCVGSGMENHGKYGELIYSYKNNDLFVNLFIASRLNWKEKGLVVSQQTRFPDEETTRLRIEAAQPHSFSIHIRYPVWVNAGQLEVKVNGTILPVTAGPDAWVSIHRIWKKGDLIEVHLPMKLTTESLPGSAEYIAFLHGPIVLAAKTDTTLHDRFVGDGNQWGGYRATGKTFPLDSMPMVIAHDADPASYLKPVAGKPQTYTAPGLIHPAEFGSLELIPFYKLHDARYVIYWKRQSAN